MTQKIFLEALGKRYVDGLAGLHLVTRGLEYSGSVQDDSSSSVASQNIQGQLQIFISKQIYISRVKKYKLLFGNAPLSYYE
jgi:hypothetical protein